MNGFDVSAEVAAVIRERDEACAHVSRLRAVLEEIYRESVPSGYDYGHGGIAKLRRDALSETSAQSLEAAPKVVAMHSLSGRVRAIQ